jgi:hypothetical protein
LKGWTRTHGFFEDTGGFCEKGQRLDVAPRFDLDSFPELYQKDPTHNPSSTDESSFTAKQCQYRILVTKSIILDKSKSDALGKFFTVLQTTWFIVQYLERWVAHQPRTQLEVMTLAYAALNILIYVLWWDKPLNVQEPIDVCGLASAPTRHPREGLDGVWPILHDVYESYSGGTKPSSLGDSACRVVVLTFTSLRALPSVHTKPRLGPHPFPISDR